VAGLPFVFGAVITVRRSTPGFMPAARVAAVAAAQLSGNSTARGGNGTSGYGLVVVVMMVEPLCLLVIPFSSSPGSWYVLAEKIRRPRGEQGRPDELFRGRIGGMGPVLAPVWFVPVRSASLALDRVRAFIEIVDQY
jgi:hypothetical protein